MRGGSPVGIGVRGASPTLAGLLKLGSKTAMPPRRRQGGQHRGGYQHRRRGHRRGRGRSGPVFPDHSPRVRCVSCVPNPIPSYHCEGWGRVRSEGRAAAVDREFELRSRIRTGEPREYVPSELSRVRLESLPDLPARYQPTPNACKALMRRSHHRLPRHDSIKVSNAYPKHPSEAPASRGQRHKGAHASEAVRTAQGPGRSKI